MTTRTEHMKALKATWQRAPIGPRKDAALKRYESAQRSNIAKIERAAMSHQYKIKVDLN
jgi:hypothetical protein